MKKVLLGSLLAGGLLFAGKHDATTRVSSDDARVSDETRVSSDEMRVSDARVSSNERIALESQSPRVHPARMHKHQKANRRMDQVVSDKHNANAYIPKGK